MTKLVIAILVVQLPLAAIAADAQNMRSRPATSLTTQPVDADAARNQLIESVLTISGMKNSLQHMPESVVSGAVQALQEGYAPIAFQDQIKKIIEQVFPADAFVSGVTDAMLRHFNERRYKHLLELLSTPLAKRMAALEAQEPSPQALQSYVLQLATQPLRPKRIAQVKSLDQDTGASALMSKLYIASIKATALGTLGDCPDQKLALEKAFAKQQKAIETATQNTMRVMMAFAYRDVSEADLEEYIKLNRTADSKWLLAMIQKAIVDQVELGSDKITRAIGALIQSKANKSMFAPKCPGTTAVDNSTTRKQATRVSRAGGDVRECLKYDDPVEVRACAEKYQ